MLENKGLNGYWIAYAILYGLKEKDLKPVEEWLLHKSPVVLATRERFYIFQKELMKINSSNSVIASIPCGLMDDLISLDFSDYQGISLVGIDIDEDSIRLAKDNARNNGVSSVSFMVRDAWDLDYDNSFDIILSNGLNIYEKDEDKVLQLYKGFHKSMKPGSYLITSFLTPPPTIDEKSPWQNYDVIDIVQQKAIFSDIIGTKWQNFMTEDRFRRVMKEANFDVISIVYDKQCMFPTVLAKK